MKNEIFNSKKEFGQKEFSQRELLAKKDLLKDTGFITTVFNESANIKFLLESLLAQSVLPQEIIIVDGGSTDNTLDIIVDFFKNICTQFIIVEKNNNGKLNKKLENIKYEKDEKYEKYGKDKDIEIVKKTEILEIVGKIENDFKKFIVFLGSISFENFKGEKKNLNEERKIFIKIFKVNGAAISEGRNFAIKNLNSNYICVSDGGCILDKNWLKQITSFYHNYKNSNFSISNYNNINHKNTSINNNNNINDKNINNNNINNNSNNNNNNINNIKHNKSQENLKFIVGGYNWPLANTFLKICLAVCVMPRKSEINPKKYMPSSRNICFTKKAWLDAGMYPQYMDFGEDMKFNFNLIGKGYSIIFNSNAEVYWNMRDDIISIFKQFFRYAKGDAIGKMYFYRHLIRIFSLLTFVLLIFLSIFISLYFLIVIFLLLLFYVLKPYLRIYSYLSNKKVCPQLKSKPNLVLYFIGLIFSIPFFMVFIDFAKLCGYFFGLIKMSQKFEKV